MSSIGGEKNEEEDEEEKQQEEEEEEEGGEEEEELKMSLFVVWLVLHATVTSAEHVVLPRTGTILLRSRGLLFFRYNFGCCCRCYNPFCGSSDPAILPPLQ